MTILGRLKTNKSPGGDGLHPRVLVELKEELATPMRMIFTTSLREGHLPLSWKEGNITPIFKKGKRQVPGNYRPISVTSTAGKCMERIVRNAIISHMTDNNLHSRQQHGFVHGRSCVTQLLAVLDAWTNTLDEGGNIDAIYLDFAKAFDTVPHKRLLVKLHGYGISGKLLAWIEAFLTGRKQRVEVNGSRSSWTEVLSGIPQGSVLGPMLFICYINDMSSVVDSPIYLFADDTKVFSSIASVDDHSERPHDLEQLEKWSEKWQPRFNANKCKVMHIGRTNTNSDYAMGTTTLVKTTNEKDLGIHVDPELTFGKHIETVVNRANRMLGLIRRSYTYLESQSLLKLYTSLVRPILEYANATWTPSLRLDQILLDNIKRRATKLVPQLKHLSYEQRLRALNLPSLYYRRARGDMIETYTYTHAMYNTDLTPLQIDPDFITPTSSRKNDVPQGFDRTSSAIESLTDVTT